MYLIIDIGTSGTKVSAVSGDGNILASRYMRNDAYNENGREMDANAIREQGIALAFEVIHDEKVRGERVEMITCSSLGEAVVPVGRDGRALAPAIIGSDPRGNREYLQFVKRAGKDRILEITRQSEATIYSVAKILYIKEHFPEIYEKTWKFMLLTDWMGYQLTGETKVDYGMASRTLLFDIRKMKFSEELLRAADLTPDLFSNPVPGISVIGNITDDIKKRWNIDYDIPVLAGAHDHVYNAIGCGAFEAGKCSNVTGTTEGLTAVFRKVLPVGVVREYHISCEPFLWEGLYDTVAWHNSAGALIHWFGRMFFEGTEEEKFLPLMNDQSSKPGDVLSLPYFAGATTKYVEQISGGTITGLTLNTTKKDIYKALITGASFELRVIRDALLRAGIPVKEIIVSGGGSRSDLWNQIKADILNQKIYVSDICHTGTIGGAMVCAYVSGRYKNLTDAFLKMGGSSQEICPEKVYIKEYEQQFGSYEELIEKLHHQ